MDSTTTIHALVEPKRAKPKRRLDVVMEQRERVEPSVRGESILRAVDGVFQRLDRLVSRALPEPLNPFAQTGAIANTTFIVACVSGVLLLVWYSTSVHNAYSSIQAMAAAPYTAGLVRSIHRYSSDACMLFVLLHAAKLFFARRFGGSRWLAWVTGIFLVGTLWFVGWLGYWLVWDARGQEVALGTARMLDGVPIFADPLSRSFLTDATVNSLLFFVVFFLHMLIPLAMGIALWLHITRLSRSRFLTRGWLTVWVIATTVALAVIFPADAAGPAKMTAPPSALELDWWFLMPVALTDRLKAGALWAIVLVGAAVLFPVPWLLARGRARVAKVVADRCNACEQCVKDCPYDAIRMVARSEAGRAPLLAEVQASKCVGCGICAGSCNSAAIGLPWFDVLDKRRHVERLVEAAVDKGDSAMVAFVCGESAGADLAIDAQGTSAELPGYRVVRVPCAGWVHALTVERLLRRGARGVLIVGCGPGAAMYREGPKWTELRMKAERDPKLRLSKVSADRVRLLELFRHERRKLSEEAERFRFGLRPSAPSTRFARSFASLARSSTRLLSGPRHFPRKVVTGLSLAAALALVTWGMTRVGYAAPPLERPELVVSFKHPGKSAEKCREPSEEDKRKLPVHMRPKKICERRRADVRLRVHVDGEKVLERAYAPRGVWSDGNSIAIEHILMPEGEHDVRVEVGDTPDVSEWPHEVEKRVRFESGHRRVVLFDKVAGFGWYE